MNDLANHMASRFQVGDIITCDDSSCELFKRECLVLAVTRGVVGVLPEGLKRVSFRQADDASLRRLREGRGIIEAHRLPHIADILSKVPMVKVLETLGNAVERVRTSEEQGPKAAMVRLDGFVSPGTATAWTRIDMLVDLIHDHTGIRREARNVLMEWILCNALQNIDHISQALEP